LTAGAGPDWPNLYARLRSDPEDAAAYTTLGAIVAGWARTDFSRQPDREDVVADTCANVVLGIGKAYGPDTFRGFVLGTYFTARRRARQWAKRSTVSLGEVEIVDAADDEVAPDERELLARCLAELAPVQRAAVELRHLAGASSAEIAETLGVSRANARQLISRGLASLRACAERAWPLGREPLS
jgi:RNA polymerase sigma factor (sigma-70 family)